MWTERRASTKLARGRRKVARDTINALAAGAAGYMLKRTPTAELLSAIKQVREGGSPMTAHIARKVVQSFQKPPSTSEPTEDLSPREKEVLDCLSHGLIYKEIAEKLGISYETVHTYIRRIYEKLQVRTRTEAAASRRGAACR